MGAKIKPVRPTEIKDKKIVREIIEQIRRKPTPSAVKRVKARSDLFDELTTK
jgi:hypothetical protein